jgi:hypothetical protein
MSINLIRGSGIQGIQTGMSLAERAGSKIANFSVSPEATDLAASIVDLKIAEIQVKASANVVKTGSEMLGSLIDTLA